MWHSNQDFKWKIYIKSVDIKKNSNLNNSSEFTLLTKSQPLATTASNQTIATKVRLFHFPVKLSELSEDLDLDPVYPGNIYLIPLKSDSNFSDLGASILSKIYDFNIEGYKEDSHPSWLNKYSFPKQEQIKEEYSYVKKGEKLKNEYSDLEQYK